MLDESLVKRGITPYTTVEYAVPLMVRSGPSQVPTWARDYQPRLKEDEPQEAGMV